MPQTLIIAEAGVNHNQSVEEAKRLVNIAQQAGADVVKFQLELPNHKTPYTLTWEQQIEVYAYCREVKMPFACTAFDVPTLEFLLERCVMEFIKIASCDAMNQPLIRRADAAKLPIIQSVPWEGKTWTGQRPRKLLYVVPEYPCPLENIHLRSMVAGGYAGLSDHSISVHVPIAAVALGAIIIEKHLTRARNLPGPDHKASLEPHEFAEMVKGIREVEKALA